MYISNVISLDYASKEADVTVSDGKNEFLCWLYVGINSDMLDIDDPMNIVDFKITALFAENFAYSDTREESAVKLQGYYAYRISAKVVDAENAVVRIGKTDICLDCPLPAEYMFAEYISFDAPKLAIYI